jgi:hypothetical protein
MGVALLERPGGDHDVISDGPEERLSSAMGLLNAATAEVVAAIAEAMAGGGWQGDGIITIEHWVALRSGVGAPGPGAWWLPLAPLEICRPPLPPSAKGR